MDVKMGGTLVAALLCGALASKGEWTSKADPDSEQGKKVAKSDFGSEDSTKDFVYNADTKTINFDMIWSPSPTPPTSMPSSSAEMSVGTKPIAQTSSRMETFHRDVLP